MEQKKFIHDFNDKYRYKFNRDLFIRSDDELVNAIRNVIYSCERDSTFVIKVIDFQVIDNYDDINSIMYQYEDSLINKVKKNKDGEDVIIKKAKNKDNIYSFINLKDSDIKLIKVDYFIQINEKKAGLVNNTITVYIAIPRLIDDFYYRINGKMYSAMYQIVDASTYNNTNSKKKEQIVTLKTIFTPIRLYRYSTNLKNIDGIPIPCTYFISSIFKKSLLVMKYIIAKMGFYQAQNFLCIQSIDIVNNISNIDQEKNYIFPQRGGMYVIVDKFLFDNIQIVQSFVYTVYATIAYMKDTEFEVMKEHNTWLKALGGEFTTFKSDDTTIDAIIEKGESVVSSLEFVYDRLTKEDLKLSLEDKEDIYCILRWIIRE